jgi:hypothetical protein
MLKHFIQNFGDLEADVMIILTQILESIWWGLVTAVSRWGAMAVSCEHSNGPSGTMKQEIS